MSHDDKKKIIDYTKPLTLFIGLLIVISAAYFGVNVSITDDGVEVTHQSKKTDISIEGVSANTPDHVILKNNTNDKISLTGYVLKEGTKSYTFSNNPPLTELESQENLTVYFVKKDNLLLRDNQKLVSTAFRIKAGETIELIDSKGNLIQSKTAL